jgi:hypothetical protein
MQRFKTSMARSFAELHTNEYNQIQMTSFASLTDELKNLLEYLRLVSEESLQPGLLR